MVAKLKGLLKCAAKVEERRLPNMAGVHFVAIDPGKLYFGWAEFHFGTLVRCGYAPSLDEVLGLAVRIPECVIEKPRVYASKRIDQNDIVELAFSAGVLAGAFTRRSTVSPQQWKGTIDGESVLRRIEARVDGVTAWQTAANAWPRSRHEHILDACGIGLRCCGVVL